MMDEEYIKLTQEWHRKGFESRQAEIDELHKRINEALDLLNASSEHRTQVPVGRLFWILKGESK